MMLLWAQLPALAGCAAGSNAASDGGEANPTAEGVERWASPGGSDVEAEPGFQRAPTHSKAAGRQAAARNEQGTSSGSEPLFWGSSFETVLLSAQGIRIPLPEPESWIELNPRAGYTGLAHLSTESELWVKHVPARRTVSVDECVELGRQQLSALRVPLNDTFERPMRTEDGYAGLARWGQGPAHDWRLLVHAVAPSRCLSVLFATKLREGAVVRIQVILERVLGRLQVRGFDERVGPVRR